MKGRKWSQVKLRPGSSSVSDIQGLLDGEDDVFDLGETVLLQDFGVGHRDVHARHPGNRGVQVVKGGA